MFEFGDTSLRRLKYVDDRLIELLNTAIKVSTIDMTIPWMGGKRSAEEQNKLFKDGVSRCDGYDKKSYHQSGLAVDVAPFVNGKQGEQNNDAFFSVSTVQAAYNAIFDGLRTDLGISDLKIIVVKTIPDPDGDNIAGDAQVLVAASDPNTYLFDEYTFSSDFSKDDFRQKYARQKGDQYHKTPLADWNLGHDLAKWVQTNVTAY